MRRHALTGLAVTGSVTALAMALSGCGSSSTSAAGGSGSPSDSGASSATRTSTSTTATTGPGTSAIPHAALTVTPTSGGLTTVFKFSFPAPAASGRQGTIASSYTLSVVGPHGDGCLDAQSMGLPAVTRGQMVTASLAPPPGSRWCAGTYTARADESARPVCVSGQMCPQFVRLVAVVGPVTFRVTP